MTNDERPSNMLEHDPDTLRVGVFAEWQAAHPDGTREQFDAEWAALTKAQRPMLTATTVGGSSWEKEADLLKHRFFEEWIARRPAGTRAQFEEEWGAVKASFGL